MKRKSIGIVGCGRIARAHAKRLRSLGCDLIFQSRSEESAQRLASLFAGARHTASLDALLSDRSLDGIVVTSPPEYHAKQAIRCLEAGKVCLIEKPLCVDRDELERLETAVDRHAATPLMVGENYLYKPLLMLIRRLLKSGALGHIRHLRMRKELTQASQGWKSSYGALFEGGIHFIAFINDIAGHSPLRVSARFPNATPERPERSSVTQLEYERGFIAELSYSWETPSATHGLLQHSRLEGERGTLVFESNGLYARLISKEQSKLLVPGLRDIAGYDAMLRDFVSCVDKPSQNPYSDFAKSRRDLITVFKAYESAGIRNSIQDHLNETRVSG